MSKLHKALSVLGPLLVVFGILYFGYYSLYIYRPTLKSVCYQSVVAQQTDIAVHVVRQWFGKDGEQYNGCPAK
jgi:hypothetical protein